MRTLPLRVLLPFAIAGIVLVSVADATASDARLQLALQGGLERALSAEAGAQGGSPTAVQDAYDAARDFQEAVKESAPVSDGCTGLFNAASRLAEAMVREQEGFDRPSPSMRSTARVQVAARRAEVTRLRATCTGKGSGTRVARVAMSPASGEAFFGMISSRGPSTATRARLRFDRQGWREIDVKKGALSVPAQGPFRQYDITVQFLDEGGKLLASAEAKDVSLLPQSGRMATPASREDKQLTARLGSIASRFPGTVSIWTQDLRDGSFAGSNAGAKFPAASTVKLGVLAGAIKRLGAKPENSPLYYDLIAIASWSSNLAANRIVKRLGSGCESARDQLANEGLRMLGAVASTYTGCYIVGTDLQPGMPSAPALESPPLNTQRYTTAQDLGRMMFALQAAAVPAPGARAEVGLSTKQARQVLGLLLASQQAGENRSLVGAGAPVGTPIAQKNGWLGSARLSASLAYLASGPIIVTVAEYSGDGVPLATAQRLGADVMRASQ